MAKNLIGTGQENTKKLRKIKKKRTNLTKFSYLFVFLTTICQHNTILGFFFFPGWPPQKILQYFILFLPVKDYP